MMRIVLLAFATVTLLVSCASPVDRPVTYGGERWSLTEIFPPGPHRELARAAADGDLRGIDRAIKSGADVNFRGKNDFTPLWWAAWDQNIKGFTRLLDLGADPNVVPSANKSVMHNTAEALWPPAFLSAALKHHGNPNLRDRGGACPLGFAITQGTREHVELLLAAGATFSSRPDGSDSVVFLAILARRFDYVLEFLQKGADPHVKDTHGYDIAQLIETFMYDPDADQYVWRERVIRFLRTKAIEAHRPLRERTRTKPLPPDLT